MEQNAPPPIFQFLADEWPEVYVAAAKAAAASYTDPRTACFYCRRALELLVTWAFQHDPTLRRPYQDNLSALIHEPSFRNAAGSAVFSKIRLVVQLGNQAVHSARPVAISDSLQALRELFHIGYWFARTYARRTRPDPGLSFDPASLPKSAPIPRQTLDQLRALAASLQERDEKLAAAEATSAALSAEIARLREEVAAAKKAAAQEPDRHDYSEAETRDYFIDLLLREAGFDLDAPNLREFPVEGMPNQHGQGFADYVLWGDDGKPLAVLEAKRTRRDPRAGQQQAKLYADGLEQQFGQRPLIFYSNGYEHWLWDDTFYPPRPVQGFYKKSELELLVLRRQTRRPLAQAEISQAIAGRYYQQRAIRRIAEAFEQDHDRKALLVMATGAGKTRTVIALCELLQRCNWVKRVLFLADRLALVRQAIAAFKRHLPDSSPINLVEEKEKDGRVFVSTYPTLLGLIDDSRDGGERRFGVGHFDLLVIDEAHRSVFRKYRAIFDYFDAFLIGLTATPKDEIDRNTYSLFDLEDGVPTDAYSLDEAVADGFLVPPRAVSVPLKFQRDGISYDELSEDEKDQWDATEWDDSGNVPGRVEPEAVNRWLFNDDTVDKALALLMERGLKVAGGDRLGKTILFAKNQAHAEFIARRFDLAYPHYRGEFARVITFETPYAQSLIDAFAKKDSAPHIAISVDLLDTGIDVPEVVNLVFFKVLHSKTKFWQMLGRGTRLCEDLFGPGENKKFFYLFDFCQNLEFFDQRLTGAESGGPAPLGKRLFLTRLGLLAALDRHLASGPAGEVAEAAGEYDGPRSEAGLRRTLGQILHGEVAAMNLANFIVRPRRRAVEKFAQPEVWGLLDESALGELANEVAGLPSELPAEPEEQKRFDLLVLQLQLALLRAAPVAARLAEKLQAIAALLAEKSAIPRVAAEMPLLLEILEERWLERVDLPALERIRRRLRELVPLIEKSQRRKIYTSFEDQLGEITEIPLRGLQNPADLERFRAKARAFLRAHQDHLTVYKLRWNKPLTAADLAELERMLVESGVGGSEDIERAKTASQGLGLFVRSLVGLDREAAKAALADFLQGKKLSGNQIELINLIVDHLTEHGVMDAALLYESPFTDLSPQGPDGLFASAEVDQLCAVLAAIRQTAIAA